MSFGRKIDPSRPPTVLPEPPEAPAAPPAGGAAQPPISGPVPPRPTAILFDWDNTLSENWDSLTIAFNDVRSWFGLPDWTRDETIANARLSMRDAFPGWFGDRWEEARDRFYAAYQRHHLAGLRPMPGIPRLLGMLARTNVWVGVVSNKQGGLLRSEAAHLGWTPFFRRIVGATDAVADKPDPAPVQLALDGSGLDPARDKVWFVGDADVDIDCARRSGCHPILVLTNPHLRREGLDLAQVTMVADARALTGLVLAYFGPIVATEADEASPGLPRT